MVIQFPYVWKPVFRAIVCAAMAGGLGLFGCGSGSVTPPAPSAESNRSSRGAANRQPPGSTGLGNVDLSAMLNEIPEYQGQGRNLFAYGQRRVAVDPTPVDPTDFPEATSTTTSIPTALPPPRVNLEFAGYVEKPERGGAKKKYAVLLDGPEILTGAVGDLVANRYEIVEIGLESVTIRVEGSRVTQRIPLRTN